MAREAPPWFPLWVYHFLADPAVRKMDAQAGGVFLFWLLQAWQEKRPGTLPVDDKILRAFGRMEDAPDAQWNASRDLALAAFKKSKDGTRWEQRRMIREFRKIRQGLRRSSEAGKKGAKKRWGADGGAMAPSNQREGERDQSREEHSTPPKPPASSGGLNGEVSARRRRRDMTDEQKREAKLEAIKARIAAAGA